MSERACGQLERACAEAYREYQKALRMDLGLLEPVTKPLEGFKPPARSATVRAETINLGRRYHDLAAQLRACYGENEVPSAEERWPRP